VEVTVTVVVVVAAAAAAAETTLAVPMIGFWIDAYTRCGEVWLYCEEGDRRRARLKVFRHLAARHIWAQNRI
jgi:hypothetical protein